MRSDIPFRKRGAVVLALITLGVIVLLGSPTIKSKVESLKNNFSVAIDDTRELFKSYPQAKPKEYGYALTIPVLLYHGISDKTDRFTISRDQFRDQMTTLYVNGYRTVTAEDFILFMEGKKELPARSFLLTFDDGRKDSYYGADPVLKRVGYTAVMFIATGQSLTPSKAVSPYYLNIGELKEMSATGRWEMGSHMVQKEGGLISVDQKGAQGYFLSNKKFLKQEGRLESDSEYDTRVRYEIVSSRESIETMLDVHVALASYPFSDYGQQSINNSVNATSEISKGIHETYTIAFQQQWPYNGGFVGNDPSDDHYHLRRIEPASDWTGKLLLSALLVGGDIQPFSFGNEVLIQSKDRWKAVWGVKEFAANGEVILKTESQPGHRSSFIILDGSRAWKDYQFTVNAIFKGGDALTLYANFKRPGTGTRCVWSQGSIVIEEIVDARVMNRAVFRNEDMLGGHSLSIISKPGFVGCAEDDVMVGALATNQESVGGVGIEFWSDKQAASLEVKKSAIVFGPEINKSVLKRETLKVKDITIDALEDRLVEDLLPVRRYDETTVSVGHTVLTSTSWGTNLFVTTSDTLKDIFTATITHHESGGVYWQWPTKNVSSTTEFEVKASYTATASTELTLQSEDVEGTISWHFIREMPVTNTKQNYTFVVEIPKDAVKFSIIQELNHEGTLSVMSPEIYPLKDGSFAQGYVTLTFDDGRASFKTGALPLLQKFKYPATLGVITSHIGLKSYLAHADLANIAGSGFEIADHTRNHAHLDAASSFSDLVKEITGSRYDFSTAGYDAKTFIYPYGSFALEAVSVVRRSGFIGARSIIRGLNTKNTDPFYLKDQLVGRDVPLSDIQGWIKTAHDEKKWLILELHNVYEIDDSHDAEGITAEKLNAILTLIRESGLQVITLHDGLQKMMEK